MTVSVSFNGSVIDTADVAANWTAIKITGGGQSPTAVAADAAYEGLNNVTCRSDNKRVYMYTDIGAGNELDFTTGGTEEGDLFYIWVNFLPSPLLALQSEGGLGIFMSTNAPSSSNYALWYFEGRDTYTGGWIRLVVDPNKTPSIDNDSFDPSSVRYFGAFAHNNQGAAKYDNFVVDQCAHGKGLIVTGSSTLGLIPELIADEIANRHGVVTALNASGTAAELKGSLILGDDVGTVASTITDEDSKIFAAEPKYYETTLQASIPLDSIVLNIVGNGTGDTSVIFGQAVGTTQGRNGIALVGNATYDISLDRDDGAVEASDFYGCSFEVLTGTFNIDGNHDFNGNSFSGCGDINVTGSGTVKNTGFVSSGEITITATETLEDVLVINSTAANSVTSPTLNNITGSFTSDGSNHAVELTGVAATYSWDCVVTNYDTGTTGNGVEVTGGSITGNETIHITATTGTFIINVAEGATIPSVSSAGAIVNVLVGQRTFTFTVSPSITGYEWRIYEDSGTAGVIGTVELDGEEIATADNQSYIYTYTADKDIVVQIIASGYEEALHYDTLTDADKSVTILLETEENT